MEIKVVRKYRKADYTIGQVYINGVYFCDSLEDTDRKLKNTDHLSKIQAVKVYGQTAIPLGKYNVSYTYSPKFGKNMPEIMNVPGYSGVRIHVGNFAKDTLGCLLLGKNRAVGCVLDSKFWFNKFMDEYFLPAVRSKELITIEYTY